MIKWIIKYADGRTFTDKDGKPWEAPRNGVARVLRHDPHLGEVIAEDSDPGYWGWKVDRKGKNGRWFAFHDLMAFHDYLFNYTDSPVIPLRGRMMHDHDWTEVVKEDVEKHFGLKKAGWLRREKRP